MTVVVLDRRIDELVDRDARVDQIATGYVFTEGPLWHPRERTLIFSDVRNDTMYRWTEAGGAGVFRKPSATGNGNTYDRKGRLLTCEAENRRVSVTNADGSVETVASHYDGKRFHSPNDVICLASGDIIFSDFPYGPGHPERNFQNCDMEFSSVYRWSARDGSVTLLSDDMDRPNGLVITDDGALLYVDDSARHMVRLFDVTADGGVANPRTFCELHHGGTDGRPDGMKLDSRGNLYIAANTDEGVWIYAPDGTLLGFIDVGEAPANLAWGDDDWRTLFAVDRAATPCRTTSPSCSGPSR